MARFSPCQRLRRLILPGLMLINVPVPIAAASPVAPAAGPWSGAAELGYVVTTGNTETQSLTAKLRVRYEALKWRHELKAELLKAEDQKLVTAESYKLEGRSEYKLSVRDYLFGLARYEDDRFAGYDRRTTEVAGYGYHLLRGETFKWDLEVGAGARQTEFTDGRRDAEGLYRLGTRLEWIISPTSSLVENLSAEQGDANRFTESTTELKVKINASLALKVGLNIKNNSVVAPGTEHTDTKSTLTLNYDF
jgi:putative salt-induced outer membrane protein